MSFTGPLSIITLVPLLSGLILLVLPNVLPNDVSMRMKASVRNVAIGLSSAIFLLTTLIFVGTIGQIDWLSIGMGDYVLETEDPVWLIESIGVTWHLGTDALSFPMIWLTTLLIPISMLVQWDAEDGHSFHSLLLIMEGALIGVFVSLDLFVFYIFWELTLVPMFFLIMIWGGEDRKYASMKFFIYTFTASVLMLVGILVMYFNTVADPNYAGTLTGHHFNLVLMT